MWFRYDTHLYTSLYYTYRVTHRSVYIFMHPCQSPILMWLIEMKRERAQASYIYCSYYDFTFIHSFVKFIHENFFFLSFFLSPQFFVCISFKKRKKQSEEKKKRKRENKQIYKYMQHFLLATLFFFFSFNPPLFFFILFSYFFFFLLVTFFVFLFIYLSVFFPGLGLFFCLIASGICVTPSSERKRVCPVDMPRC